MSVLAVFIALGGSAIAINKIKANSVGSKQIKAKAVKNADLADNAVTSPKVADGSLLEQDFAANQLPRGATGPQGQAGATGPQGVQGVQGATGTVDTSNFYDKAASDARFLGIGATAADSTALGGFPDSVYPKAIRDINVATFGGFPRIGFARRVLAANAGSTQIIQHGGIGAILVSCGDPAQATVAYHNFQGGAQDVWINNMTNGNLTYASVAGGADSAGQMGMVNGPNRYQFIVGSGQTTVGSGARTIVFDVTLEATGSGINTCIVQVQSQSLIV